MSEAAKIQEVELIREPSSDIIETLENLMILAKAGELRAFAFATVRPGAYAGQGWSYADDANMHVLMSGVACLEHRLVEFMREGCEEGFAE